MSEPGTIWEMFLRSASRFESRPFLHAPEETARAYDIADTDYTFGEALAAAEALAKRYARIGCAPGLRIGLALDNRPSFFLHFLAVNSLGASIMPINSAMQPEELAYQIAHSECALIVSAPQHMEKLRAIADDLERQVGIVEASSLASAPMLAGTQGVGGAGGLEAEAAILYTSGTTGSPKGCLLSNDYFIAIGELYTTIGGLCRFDEGSDRLITPLPATHMNALACSFMAMMTTGGCLIQLDRFHPQTWWKTVRESRATIMHYLGVMPAMLIKAPESEDDNFSGQIKFAFGAGCDPRHHEAFERRFGISLVEAWAMTETGAGAWITASEEPRHVGTRCFGRAPEGLEWRLIDEEGKEVAAGEPGELLVRRAGAKPREHFFSAYFKDEKATEEAWRGGWFHTGDVVRVGDDGSFYFVDRRKNVIRRSGENIAAIDVESVLLRHEHVAGCVVAPVPDEIRGDEVAALIVAAEGANKEKHAREIFDFAMEHLVYFKAPGYVAFIDKLPVTASEKVKRGDAKMIARKLVEDRACFDFTALKKPKKG